IDPVSIITLPKYCPSFNLLRWLGLCQAALAGGTLCRAQCPGHASYSLNPSHPDPSSEHDGQFREVCRGAGITGPVKLAPVGSHQRALRTRWPATAEAVVPAAARHCSICCEVNMLGRTLSLGLLLALCSVSRGAVIYEP